MSEGDSILDEPFDFTGTTQKETPISDPEVNGRPIGEKDENWYGKMDSKTQTLQTFTIQPLKDMLGAGKNSKVYNGYTAFGPPDGNCLWDVLEALRQYPPMFFNKDGSRKKQMLDFFNSTYPVNRKNPTKS
jgi:hypothetical protein